MTNYLFIVNPHAGKGNAKKFLPVLQKRLSREHDRYKIAVTDNIEKSNHILEKHRDNFQNIIAVGGDGTINDVINNIDLDNNIFGVLPVGSGNDFSRNLKMNLNSIENLEYILKEDKKIKNVDIGFVEYFEQFSNVKKSTYFANGLGIGFDALVAHINQKNKILSGLISYIIAVLRASIQFKHLRASGSFDRFLFENEQLLIAIGNGYTTGGGFRLTPDANVYDKLFDVCLINKMNTNKLIRSIPKALTGKIHNIEEVVLKKFSEANIKLQEPYYVHCDGEIISSQITELNIKVLPEKLRTITME